MLRIGAVLVMLFIVAAASVTSVNAQWVRDGVPVCTAQYIQRQLEIVPDGAGGVIAVWTDERNGWDNWDIFSQRVDSSGIIRWTLNGIHICDAQGDQVLPKIIHDGAGGAIIAWQDGRDIIDEIRAQRIDTNGTVLWAAGGVPISTPQYIQLSPELAGDGAGGAIITWFEHRITVINSVPDTSYNVYAQRVDANGTALWDPTGAGVCVQPGNQTSPVIVSDGAGGAIIAWIDGRSPGTEVDIYAQRIDGSGAVVWDSSGVAICTASGNQQSPHIVSDGAGEAIVTWQDSRTPPWDIYAQRIGADGTVRWAADGITICTVGGDRRMHRVVSDGSGGAVITWDEYRFNDRDIIAQRLDSLGGHLWGGEGAAVCTLMASQSQPTVSSDGDGGFFITWRDARDWDTPREEDIYAQRLAPEGTPQWADGGVPICLARGEQRSPHIIHSTGRKPFAVWEDFRQSVYRDLFAMRLSIFMEVLSPDSAEVLDSWKNYDITWSTQGEESDSILILLSIDSGTEFPYAIHSGPPDPSIYTWNVYNIPTETARIEVIAYAGGAVGGYDISDRDFSIDAKPYRYVSPAGAGIFPYSMPAWAANTIPVALDAASPGDTIMVAGATYSSTVIVMTPVFLMGGWNDTFSEWNPALYETELKKTGSVVSFMYTDTARCGIEGFTLRNGTGTIVAIPESGFYGGGVFCYQSSPVIRGNRIVNCGQVSPLGFSAGGAICCYGGEAVIEDNEITGSSAQWGGGIYLYETAATINGNRIVGSSPDAEYGGGKFGGGIYATLSTVFLDGNVIRENNGYTRGGGIYATLSILSSHGDSILSNECLDTGGGIYADETQCTISRAVIVFNTAVSSGGGIYHKAERIDLANSIIALNDAGLIGGGIYTTDSWGSIDNNTIDRNYALYGGGNVFLGTMVSLGITNNLITFGHKYGFQANTLENITFSFNNCFGN
ncbi:MAG: hypothetical protein JSV33_13430, partial [bacterium]